MIIKSMSRKEGSFRQLIEYMEKDRGEAAFGHNLFGNPFGRRDDIIREFERNAGHLRDRKNGNTLYHEVISLEAGANLRREEMVRILGEIGREYVARRAPNQMSFGMVHTDAKHIHLHICLSANAIGKDRRERLSKKAFADIQKEMEALVRSRWSELAQAPIYGKDRNPERLKTTVSEQEMKRRRGEPSRKEDVKARLHSVLEGSRSAEELVTRLRAEGLEFYQRGKTVGVIDGRDGRKHRLSTLGVGEHYEATVSRLFSVGKGAVPPEPPSPSQAREKAQEEARKRGAGDDGRADRRHDGRGEPDSAREKAPAEPQENAGSARERAPEGPDTGRWPGEEERRREELQDLLRSRERERNNERGR